MKEFKAKTKREMIELIREGYEDREVYVNLRPCIDIVVELLENGPNLSVIYCPPSLCELTSKRVKNALEKVGISLVPRGGGAGRPSIYSEDDITEIRKLMKIGLSVTRISQELDIPRRTIYHLLGTHGDPDEDQS